MDLRLQVVPLYPEYAPGNHSLPEGPEGYTLFHAQVVNDSELGPILYLLWCKA